MARAPRNQPETAKAQAQSRAEHRRLAAAYADLFGTNDANRSPIQKLVYNDLMTASGIHDSIVRVDQVGRVDSGAVLIKDGNRMMMLRIINKIREAAEPPEYEQTETGKMDL